ncbi:hypothetical protein ACOYR1_11275 [Thalassotalea piscium]
MQWQELMVKGNNHFEEKQWNKAESYYMSVCSQLEGQWHKSNESESLLMAWICACHNLSTLYEAKGEYESAIQCLVRAYQQSYITSQNDQASNSLRYLAFNALKTTLNPILSFTKKYPTCEDCLIKLKRLQKILTSEINTVH